MNHRAIRLVTVLAVLAVLALSGQVMAAGDAPLGKVIHKSTVEGHKLTYRLIDVKEKMKGMTGSHSVDPAKLKSHHLMLLIEDGEGKPVTKAKVGYLVVGPDGEKQKAMAMFMNGGFGADVDLKIKGAYQIKAKVLAGSVKLMDGFSYKVD